MTTPESVEMLARDIFIADNHRSDNPNLLWATASHQQKVYALTIAQKLTEIGYRLVAKTPSGPCHECRCFLSAPCNACVGCKHIDYPECPNDCQECEEPHEH